MLHRFQSPNFQNVRFEFLSSGQEIFLLLRSQFLTTGVVTFHRRSPPTITLEYKICVTEGKGMTVMPQVGFLVIWRRLVWNEFSFLSEGEQETVLISEMILLRTPTLTSKPSKNLGFLPLAYLE